MKILTKKFYALFALFLLLASCQKNNNLPDAIYFEPSYLNQQIKLSVPAYFNSLKTTDPVRLEFQYYSDKEIVFPRDFNLRIFKLANGSWIEIKELPTDRYPNEDFVFRYILNEGMNNDLVIQRGRMKSAGKDALKSLWERAKGK